MDKAHASLLLHRVSCPGKLIDSRQLRTAACLPGHPSPTIIFCLCPKSKTTVESCLNLFGDVYKAWMLVAAARGKAK